MQKAAQARGMSVQTALREALAAWLPQAPATIAPTPEVRRRRRGEKRVETKVAFWAEDARKIAAVAAERGITQTEAIRTLIHAGHQALASEAEPSDVRRALAVIESRLEVLGPVVLGTLRLIVYSSARAGGAGPAEDELFARVRAAGQDEWAALTEAPGRGSQGEV